MSDPSTITSVSLGRGPSHGSESTVSQLVVLACAEDPAILSSSHGLDDVDEVRFHRGPREALRRIESGRRILDLSVPDARMSSDHGRLLRGPSGWILDDPGSKNGAIVDGALTRRTVLDDGAVIELGRTFFLFRHHSVPGGTPPWLRGDVTASLLPAGPDGFATFAPALARELDALARIAGTSVPLVLLGATGTGKEVVARAMHTLSRRPGPFVAVNCGALPANLIESELFGHRRGAFSGADRDRPGLVRSADRGTLFLDEIGELPLGSQAAFLRVLQEQEVVPVGDDRPVKVDVRLCAATLRDLEGAVEAGSFRADLYARLLGHAVTLPLLRERREDLGLLLGALRERVPGAAEVRLTPAALRAMLAHSWPRNIRELEKVLGTAVALAGTDPIDLPHLPPVIRDGRRAASTTTPPLTPPVQAAAAAAPVPAGVALDDEDRELRLRLLALFAEHEGNVVAVAEAMGKRRAQIYKWIKRLAIDVDGFRKT